MNKVKIVLYALIAIGFQVGLGYLTGKGQGGIGMLTFLIIMELDPNYSFTYLLEHKDKNKK
ncbi:hypothetical protein [Candidatus Xianfuyuplasma coldseepsis]|uniref:Uncharacterized protein n=1 Tax=Candidatus Xianfuyuplasma coldseepsis TaxID=2782163 RepID=A0A7L7KQH9_9MOLU|nr:hypothetical protein [Xianfuyuplasma coldseepsis]QMS84689.1 hypothetical protein G4Z02_02620 [Xianfuyuplasma coldseepsis]